MASNPATAPVLFDRALLRARLDRARRGAPATFLLDRVAPEALGGTAKRYFTDVSYVYELTAPMETVVDLSERDRTGEITAPVRPVR